MYELPEIHDHASPDIGCAGEKENETAGEFIRLSAKKLRDPEWIDRGRLSFRGGVSAHAFFPGSSHRKGGRVCRGAGTGSGVEKDTERFTEEVRSIDEYLRESQVKFQRDSGSLRPCCSLVETAYRPLSVFKTIVKHLHMLGVSTRIENARLNKDGNFDTLSEHVEKLSAVIASKAEAILEATGLIA